MAQRMAQVLGSSVRDFIVFIGAHVVHVSWISGSGIQIHRVTNIDTDIDIATFENSIYMDTRS